VSDYRDLRLPDASTIPLTVGGVAAVAAGVWPGALADACAGVAALIGLGAIGTAAGRQLGVEIGRGDWKLLAATGAWLGLSGGAVAASISWLLAAAVLAAEYRMRPGETVQLAFGVILGPVAVMVINAAESAEAIISGIRSGTLSAPLPPESVKSIPLVGGKVYDAWYLAATNLVGVLQAHSGTVLHAGGWLAGSFAGAGVTLLLFIISIIVSGFLYRPGPAIAAFARRLGGRVAGQRGVEFIAMAGATIRNVSRGVMGVAIGQSILLGIGMMAAGVPAAGLLTLVILILCIVQVGPALVVIGVLVWAWTSLGTAAAILLTIYLVVVALGDNLVKPALMSKGLSTPTLVIFAGVLGGTIAHGLIGLFLGPIVLAVSYDLLMAWLDPSSAAEAGGAGGARHRTGEPA